MLRDVKRGRDGVKEVSDLKKRNAEIASPGVS